MGLGPMYPQTATTLFPEAPELSPQDPGISGDACLFLLEPLVQVQSDTYLVVHSRK